MDKILKVLEGVELNEEQVKAFDEFFAEFTEKVKNETAEVYQEELDKLTAKVQTLTEGTKAQTGKYSPENVAKAFELYKEDISKEHQEEIEALKDEMANQLAETMQSVYEDVEARAKQDLSESREMKTLDTLKKVLAPLMVNDESLVEQVNTLQEELNSLKGQKEELTREKTIATLLEGIPSEFVDYVKDFISKGETEEAIYEHYETIIPIIEMKIKNANIVEDEVDEADEVEEEEIVEEVDEVEEIEDAIEENVVFKSNTARKVISEQVVEESADEDMSEEDALRLIYAASLTPHGYK